MKIYTYKDFMVWTFFLVLAICMAIGFAVDGSHGAFKGAYLSLCVSIPLMIAISFANLVFTKNEEKKVRADWEAYEREQQRRHQQKINHWTMSSEKFFAKFQDFLTACLVIDSNIWMSTKYKPFFVILEAAFKSKGYQIEMYSPQFDEIANLKNTARDPEQSAMANIAIDRIEQFQKKGLLLIRPLHDASTMDSADSAVIVQLLSENMNNGIRCTFFSEDKETRVRARQFLADSQATNWEIIDIEDIIGDCFHCENHLKQKHIDAATA
jgi:hypothetical protein